MAGVDILASAFSGGNAAYLADLYARWVDDPDSVDPSYVELFAALGEEGLAVSQDALGASWAPRHYEVEPAAPRAAPAPVQDRPGPKGAGVPSAGAVRAAADDSLRAMQMIRAYRVRGHLEARLDPLGLQIPKQHADLNPATYGFGAGRFRPADLSRPRDVQPARRRDRHHAARCWRRSGTPIAARSASSSPMCRTPQQRDWIQEPHRGWPLAGHVFRRRRRTRSCASLPRRRASRRSARSAMSAPSGSGWRAARSPSRRCRRSSTRRRMTACARSPSACRTGAGSTRSPTSCASRTPRSSASSAAPRSSPTTCRAPAT